MTLEIRAPADHPRTAKLWGGEVEIFNSREVGYCGKILILHEGFQGSLHRHARKHETMLVLKGRVELDIPSEESERASPPGVLECMRLGPGDSIVLPPGTWHRFRALTREAQIVEFSTPHDDADVERAEPARELRP